MTPALQTKLRQIRAIRHTAGDQLDDAMYRDILQRCAGVTSSTEIRSLVKATAILAEFDRLGIGRQSGRPALTAMQRKMWSLWQQLADAGLVTDRKMPGLVAWVSRHTGVGQLRWLTWPQEHSCVEALKRWLARKQEDSHG